MSLDIGTLVGFVDLDTSGVRKGAAETRTQVNRLGNDIDSVGSRTASRFGSTMGLALKRVGLGMAGLGIAGGVMGLKTAASMENADIAFTTMLGSATKAHTFLKKLADFAAATPFEFPELQTAASSLISAGVNAKDVIPIMTTLGNVTSGMGTGAEGVKRATVALQQMQAAGKITGEDLNQLRDAGIPVYDLLAKATGKSKAEVVKLAQAGKLGSKELGQMMSALKTGKGMERFSGLMEKQSKSLGGMWSTFTDTLNMQLAKAIAPALPAIKDALGKASEFIAVAIPKIAAAIAALGPVFEKVKANAKPMIDAVMGFFHGLSSGEGSGKLNELKATFMDVFESVKTIVSSAVTIITILWNSFGSTILAYASRTFSAIMLVVKGAFDIIAGIFKVVSSLMKGDWKGAWDGIKQIVQGAWELIKGVVKQGLNLIRTAFSVAMILLKGIAGRTWDGIKSTFMAGVNGIVSLVRAIPGMLGKLGSKFGAAGKGLLQSFVDGMKNAAGVIKGIAGNVWDTVKGLLNGALRKINAALEFKISLPGPDLHINPPDIPMLATGGRATGATLAVFGEGREAENVLPDSLLRGLLEKVHAAGKEAGRAESRGGDTWNVYGAPGMDENILAEKAWFKTRTRG